MAHDAARSVALLLVIGEIINGNIRVRILHRMYGKKKAKTISFFSGTAIIFVITWLTLGWISPNHYLDCLTIGGIWLVIMVCLDIYFGKYVFKFNTRKIAEDFNPLKGNLLGVGMVLLFFMPCIVFWLQATSFS